LVGKLLTSLELKRCELISDYQYKPSLTPSAETTTEKETDKIQPMCAASQLHPVTIKSLINVLFTHEDGKSGNAICPACMKGLNNGTKISGKLLIILEG
jgi:hypothetical protein